MHIMADTNIFLAVALNEPERDRVIRLTVDASALAPEILPYEIGNALSAMVKRRQLTQSEALEPGLFITTPRTHGLGCCSPVTGGAVRA